MKMILGPCAIESKLHAISMARSLALLQEQVREAGFEDFEIIYKSSFSKANRTKAESYRGVGVTEGLDILEAVKDDTGLRVTSDVHTGYEAAVAGQVLDVIQIPHQMCRNTDLLEAAAETGKVISVKKGTFMNPEDFQHVAAKIRAVGNTQEIIAVERGNHFGYGNTVVDMRNFHVLNKKEGRLDSSIITCIDATHPGCGPEGAKALARAGVAAGAQMVFLETHDQPTKAPCDGTCMIPLHEMYELIIELLTIREVVYGDVSNVVKGITV
jgi:2-dehydro-3-deoxyphosphooctonate aldolase (KDO 8-P synthase)